MLEVTPQDISTLNDTDLRSLIGYLCEAEVCRKGLETHGITYGGHQNAKDGGIDVRVDYNVENWIQGFIPRKYTGLQVKKPEMPPSEIPKEMAPKGELRDSIRKLVEINGAYIIISSQSSTADSALEKRREAMREVIDNHFPHGEIFLDFYDSQRVATWVNTYPSLAAWVRKKVGRDIEGWQGYDNWAYSRKGINETYLIDESVRFSKKGSCSNSQSISIEDGLKKLRSELRNSRAVIRLVGLSGVGKTRFVQALFDETIGENALEKSLVLYTDIGDAPKPSPKQMLEQLIQKDTKTYLIIDNCPPELHKKLTNILQAISSGNISLLTIEYDVKDETNEETEVYHLEKASKSIISEFIIERYEHIDNASAWRIAELSGGNFRIANALASVVSRGENISSLSDKTIFKRLFEQRNEENNNLEVVAEVCSLVYSFNIDTTSQNNKEIELLSSLAGMSVQEFYRNVFELQSRDLIQKRGVYGAFLPHALANRLAVNTLEKFPLYKLKETFGNVADWRLYRSFTKRLSYLHFSEKAKQFAEEWLKELKNPSNMDEKKMHLLECAAPLNVELTLKTLEEIYEKDFVGRFYSRKNPYYSRLCRLLIHLAHEPQYFKRSAKLLVTMALKEREEENIDSIRAPLNKLFHLYLSHTHASIEQRIEIIDQLITSENKKEQSLGINLLNELMEAGHFSSYGLFEFGGHIRGLGYHPKSHKEVKQWYRRVAEYCLGKYSIEGVSNEIPVILANNLRDIWSIRYCFEVVEYICLKMLEKGLWVEGWMSIKSILKYDSHRLAQPLLVRLETLEKRLRPNSLEERLKIFLTSKRFHLDFCDCFDEDKDEDGSIIEFENNIESQAKKIGEFLSKEKSILVKYFPDLSKKDNRYLEVMGKTVSENYCDKKELWNLFKENLNSINENVGYKPFLIGVLSGFNAELIAEVFKELVESNYINCLINFRNCLFTDLEGINRLICLIKGKSLTEIHISSLLALRFNNEITPEKFFEFLNVIKNSYPELNIIAHFLYELILFKKENFLVYEPIINMMHESLMSIFSKDIKQQSQLEMYEYGEIINYIYSLPKSTDKFRELLSAILDRISSDRIYEFYIDEILEALVIVKPNEFLELTYKAYLEKEFTFINQVRPNPLSHIDDELLISWIKDETKAEVQLNKIKMLLKNIDVYSENDNICRWSKLGLYIIKHFYKNEEILIRIKNNILSISNLGFQSGSTSNVLDGRRRLLTEIFDEKNQELSSWAKRLNEELVKEIEQMKKEELENDRRMQYFEY